MPPNLRTRDSVLKAVAEHDRLGRARFLSTHGFGEATKYMVRVNDRLYDSKAIVGVAFGFEHPNLGPLDAHSFSGGVSRGAAAWQLARLGFAIVSV